MEKLFIVDLMPFLYRGHFVFLKSPRMTASGINTSALLGLVNGLMSILKRERPERMVLAMDPGGPTFRHRAYPPYKAQREKMPEDLAASIPYAFEVADALGIPVVRVDDFEADDVMGTIAVKGAAAGFDVYLATPDKDAAQLVRPGVKLYRPARSGDAAEVYGRIYKKQKFDCVIVDPPRKGMDEKVVNALLASPPKRIVYVSCNPATLARDVKLLTANGVFKFEKAVPVDMFPMTEHIETVALLSR